MRKQYSLPILVGSLALVAAVGGEARADQKADLLLSEVASASKNAKTLSATVAITRKSGAKIQGGHAVVRLKKPNYCRLDISSPEAKTIVSDGKITHILKSKSDYQSSSAAPDGSNLSQLGYLPISMFYEASPYPIGAVHESEPRYVGVETLKGVKYQVVELTGDSPSKHVIRLYISPNKLLTRTTTDVIQKKQHTVFTFELNNIKINEPMTVASFAFKAPKIAKQATPQDAGDPYEAKLIPVGKSAPVFSLPSPKGGSIALSDTLRGKKAVLVNFWFYG